jgi:uncharacterized 2Fe-2S/4Fe-4S cluster protein (DUF4445 family)
MTSYQVDFEPIGRRVDVPGTTDLLSAAREAGIALAAVCGGGGTCGACKVCLVQGALSDPTAVEWEQFSEAELAAGWRLACQAFPKGHLKIEIPPESLTASQRLQLEGVGGAVPLAPAVQAKPFTLTPPAQDDLRADWARLADAFRREGQEIEADLPVKAAFSSAMRRGSWSGLAVMSSESRVIGFLPPDTPIYGLAVDIGTTKMAVFLLDLATGAVVARKGVMNPQIAYGEDVVARIAYANQSEANCSSLQRRVVETLNAALTELCRSVGADLSQVVDAVVVGNTVMHHLFAGLPVRQLGEAPYVAAVQSALRFPAREVGLHGAPGAQVYLPPNIAGYVGADHVSMLLASLLDELPGVSLALDIGTNTEISLAKAGQLVSCSCASGPAFEGAHIHAGMRAVPGAIERAQFYDGEWRLATVDDIAPIGICGSGILDVVAALLQSGQIDEAGRFTEQAVGRVDFPQGDAIELVSAENAGTGKPILVTRGDIREIQLAKAAIRAGLGVLLDHAGVQAGEIDHFIVAGAFGTYLRLESAVAIGMFPKLPGDRYHQIGNAAGVGAQMMLVSTPSRQTAEALVEKMRYIELTSEPGFMDYYVDAMTFTH